MNNELSKVSSSLHVKAKKNTCDTLALLINIQKKKKKKNAALSNSRTLILGK